MPRYSLPRLLAHGPLALLLIVIGLLHRHATANPWADDRILVEEPPWFQIAAPLLHAAVPGSPSLTNVLAGWVDRLSDASTTGDIRALAACLAASSAGVIFVSLQRLRVPTLTAVLLSFATVGFILPVATATSAAYGLQLFLGVSLLVVLISAGEDAGWRRITLLVPLTILGAMNHATFLACAAVVWGAEWRRAAPGRAAVTTTAVLALGVGLLMTAWLVSRSAAIQDEAADDRLSTLDAASGLLTGRFTPEEQPSSERSSAAAVHALPGPLIVVIPLAAMAWMRRDARRFVVSAGCVGLAGGLFAFSSWLPDPTVAYAPAWMVMIALVGLGLSWLAEQRVAGAKILAALAAVTIGLNGFYDPARADVGVDAGRLQAFALSAPIAISDGVWTAERLATDRALLLQPTLAPGASRVPVDARTLHVPEDRHVIVLPEGVARFRREGGLSASIPLPYPSAASFIASYRDDMWLAIAVREGATQDERFWNELLARFGATEVLAATHRLAGLARTGSVTAGSSSVQADRLALDYGETVGSVNERLPASFAIETDPTARVIINGDTIAETPEGAAVVMFDPWSSGIESWVVGRKGRMEAPEIRDRRLQAAYHLGLHTSLPDVQLPAITPAPVRTFVNLHHGDWFGSGWHSPEGSVEEPFRWTAAERADVHVAVSQSHALRVRIGGGLATAPNLTNELGISWNGTTIQPISPWNASSDGEWIVPARLVRRGLNVLAVHVAHLVSPATAGLGADTRSLGAAIHFISFEPAVVASGSR